MPDAAQTPPLHFTTLEEAIGEVRDRGLRLSTARRLVLQALFAAGGPASAQQLSNELSIDATSVYRNLELLERVGIVRHVHLAHGAGLYELAGRQEREYLYCERCSTVTAVGVQDLDDVREMIKTRFGFDARFTHFAIVGICQRCAGATLGERAPGEGPHSVARPNGSTL